MLKALYISIVFVFLVSCSGKKIFDNSDLIPKDELANILIDFHLIDGTINSHNNHERDKIYLSKNYYDSVVFKKHFVSQELFEKSIKEYTMQGQIKEVYTTVIDSLNTLKVTLEQTRQRSINATKQKQKAKQKE